MRTIQIVNVRWFNATAWYGLWLAKLLQEAGHETMVLTLPDTDNWKKAEEFGFKPVFLPFNSKNPLAFPGLYLKLRRLVKDFRPDIINCHRGEGFIACALLREDLKNFGLVRTRGDQRLPKTNLPNLIMHRRMADAVIATNSRMSGFFLKEMGLPPNQVHTILGGVDTARFSFCAAG
ncbi:MAG: glycosyltransferase, partial [Desulfovibrionaceae bacterium]|nr:glycosyltransferase [Desulfovibrionaceae bacterium]